MRELKKIGLYVLGVFVLLFAIFYTVTGGGIEHRNSGGRGFSDTIEESKERKVFVKKLDFKIVPDSIKLIKGKTFYIERGYRYGDFSYRSLEKNTKPLKKTDDYIYQIRVNPSFGELFFGGFLLSGGDSFLFHKMKDTVRSNIVTKVPQYDSIYKVGELLLFENN
jgi:hypothetical protein